MSNSLLTIDMITRKALAILEDAAKPALFLFQPHRSAHDVKQRIAGVAFTGRVDMGVLLYVLPYQFELLKSDWLQRRQASP